MMRLKLDSASLSKRMIAFSKRPFEPIPNSSELSLTRTSSIENPLAPRVDRYDRETLQGSKQAKDETMARLQLTVNRHVPIFWPYGNFCGAQGRFCPISGPLQPATNR